MEYCLRSSPFGLSNTMYLHVLCSHLMLTLIFRKKLPVPTPGRHVSNELDRLTRDYREFELETISVNVIKLKTSATDVQEAMAEVENYLQILKNIAKEVSQPIHRDNVFC